MVAKKKVELNVMFGDQKSKTSILKAVASLAGVDEVKMAEGKVIVIGEVDPAKLSRKIKKVGQKEGCFGYKKLGREIYVEIATVGKPPEKPKCGACNQEFCQKCCKCHNPTCKNCFKYGQNCCSTCSKTNSTCPFAACHQSLNLQPCCSSSCSCSNNNDHSCHQQPFQPYIPPPHYKAYPVAQVVDYPTCYHESYGGGCSIL